MSATNPMDEVGEDDLRALRRAGALLPRAPGNRMGPAIASRTGSGLMFREHRPYRPGDDARRIDWPVSARRGRLYARGYDEDRGGDWAICLDHSASMGHPDLARWHLAVQLAAALAYLLLDGGSRVTSVVFSDEVDDWCPPGSGSRQYLRLTQQLRQIVARAPRGGSNLAAVAERSPADAHLLVISDFLQDDAMVSALRVLQRPGRELQLLQISSPADAAAVDAGPVELCDVESGERLAVAAGAHRQAQQATLALQQRLRRYCATAGIHLGRCDSRQHWRQALLRHLGQPVA